MADHLSDPTDLPDYDADDDIEVDADWEQWRKDLDQLRQVDR